MTISQNNPELDTTVISVSRTGTELRQFKHLAQGLTVEHGRVGTRTQVWAALLSKWKQTGAFTQSVLEAPWALLRSGSP